MLVECSGSRIRASVRTASSWSNFLALNRSSDLRVNSLTLIRLSCSGVSAGCGAAGAEAAGRVVGLLDGLDGAATAPDITPSDTRRHDRIVRSFTYDTTRATPRLF